MPWNRIIKAFFALGFGLSLSLLLCEITARAFGLDAKAAWMSRSVVGFPWLAKDIHQPSQNHQLLYELAPNMSASSDCSRCTHPLETKYRSARININSLGFRGAEFAPKKQGGIFRIFFVGASNTFGALVSDEDAYPAQLQKILASKFPNKFEIINAGVSGYVLSQDSIRAQEIIDKYQPDLIFIQHSNTGRRSFYYRDRSYAEHFIHNRELFNENLPNLYSQSEASARIHKALIDSSATYRMLIGVLNYAKYRFSCEGANITNCLRYNPVRERFDQYGEMISQREFNALVANNKDIRFVFLRTDGNFDCRNETDKKFPNLSYFNLCKKPAGPEYAQIHPPSYVYAWYADKLADFIYKLKSIYN